MVTNQVLAFKWDKGFFVLFLILAVYLRSKHIILLWSKYHLSSIAVLSPLLTKNDLYGGTTVYLNAKNIFSLDMNMMKQAASICNKS